MSINIGLETINPTLNEFQQEIHKMITEYENNNPTIKFDEYLKLCATNLKKLNLISTRFQIEAIKYGHTEEYSCNLENNIKEQKLQFFLAIIGFIDGVIESNNKNKNANGNYQQADLRTTRSRVITNFKELFTEKEPTALSSMLITIPAYNNFSSLYQYFSKNSLPLSLINSYNIGYENNQYNPKEIFELYQGLYSEMNHWVESLRIMLEVEKIKILSNKKVL